MLQLIHWGAGGPPGARGPVGCGCGCGCGWAVTVAVAVAVVLRNNVSTGVYLRTHCESRTKAGAWACERSI